MPVVSIVSVSDISHKNRMDEVKGKRGADARSKGEEEESTYSLRSVFRYFMSCVLDDDIHEPAFLVHDTKDVSILIHERCLRSLREALNTIPSRILQ